MSKKLKNINKIFIGCIVSAYLISKTVNVFPINFFNYGNIPINHGGPPIINVSILQYYHQGVGSSTIHIPVNIDYYF
ncbi:hypothetical protein YN1_7310 [Nanoarchaeota archaeon]